MPLPDTSASARTMRQQERVLARFKSTNPGIKEQGPNQGTDQSIRVSRRSGNLRHVSRVPGVGVVQEPVAQLLAPTGVTDIVEDTSAPNDGIYSVYSFTWTPDPVATEYEVLVDYPGTLATQIIENSVTIKLPNYSTSTNATLANVGIRASNIVGSTTIYTVACFLAGSLVSMYDGTTKPIEEVAIGDFVVGAFGEKNEILALQHVHVGHSTMYRINDEHSTTDHHPHVSADKSFYTPEPTIIDSEVYGKDHDVITEEGFTVMRLHGLKPGRVKKMGLGHLLKTIEGCRPVVALEPYSLPPETPLYNLVVSGSHTYHVDGYAVTGWPREDDFDYDAWVPKKSNA
jgi:hypothetical protein